MAIKVFFALLVLCTIAVVAVILAIHFRVRRHLRQQSIDSPAQPVVADVAESTPQQKRVQQSS